MAGMDLPLRAIREQIASAVDVIVQLTRLRDGTRRVTHVTEVQGMEGETVTLQDAFLFDYSAGVDAHGRFLGKPVPTGVRPRFTDRFDELGITLSPRVFGAAEPAGGAGLVMTSPCCSSSAWPRSPPRCSCSPSSSCPRGPGARAAQPARPVGRRRRRPRWPGRAPPPVPRWRRCWSSAAALAAGAAALERAGMSMTPAGLRAGRRRWPRSSPAAVGVAARRARCSACCSLVVVPARRQAAAEVPGRRGGRRAFADQLDDSLQLMAGSLRAGHSLLRAVDSVSPEADAPTSEEFARIVNETRVGRDLNDALDEVAERMGSDDFTWVAQAIAIHREVGGNLAEVLDAVGHTIRERNAIRRQVKALSAEGKLSAIVLMALPFGVIGFISMTNPGYLAKFTESLAGYAMLGRGRA